MAKWNREFFQNGAPSGVLLVDPSLTNEKDAEKLQAELETRALKGRQMMVIRATPGTAAWADIAYRHRDIDFAAGRLLTRQAVFDALGFHVGVVSESSTEAHARVSERLVRNSAYARQVRTASRLNDVLAFWPGAESYQVRFNDVRVIDWEQEARKLASVSQFMTINEVRTRYLDLGALPGLDVLAAEVRNRGKEDTQKPSDDVGGASQDPAPAIQEGS